MFRIFVGDALAEFAPEETPPSEWDLEGVQRALRNHFDLDFRLEPPEEEEIPQPMEDFLFDQAVAAYRGRVAGLADDIRKHYREQVGGDDAHIDFQRIARKRIHDLELMVLLRTVDDYWIKHLYEMDYLRESVNLRAFGQIARSGSQRPQGPQWVGGIAAFCLRHHQGAGALQGLRDWQRG